MKICKACGEVNEDENLVCKNGDCLSRGFEDYETVKRNVDSNCLLYTSPSPRDLSTSRMPSSA